MPEKKTNKANKHLWWMGTGGFLLTSGCALLLPAIIFLIKREDIPVFASLQLSAMQVVLLGLMMFTTAISFIVAGVICIRHGSGIVMKQCRYQANTPCEE